MSPFSIYKGDASVDKNSADRDVQAEIKTIVTEHPVVLFMKGTPEMPQCGFSMRASQILMQHYSDFFAVNVLADQALREGIKIYSDWPTIPQVYVKGEFIGGCDILMEMHTSGELASLFA